MDAARIHYARTQDGVSIAYSVAGEGPLALVLLTPPFCHAQLAWELPDLKQIAGRLLVDHTVAFVDLRGTGLSDRDIARLTLDGLVMDLDAVVSRLEAKQVDIFAAHYASIPALAFALARPEMVRRIVLEQPTPRPRDDRDNPQTVALGLLMVRDWDIFADMVGLMAFGWSGEAASHWSRHVRESTTPTTARHYFAFFDSVDLMERLPDVSAETLVIHHKDHRLQPLDTARRVAALIPNARLANMDGNAASEATVRLIADFLAPEPRELRENAQIQTPFRTILFTDLADHTAMMQRLGDVRGREVLREHERISREALRAHGGTEVKTIGDSFMASFPSAQKAVECAIALQRAFASTECAGERLRIRVGINAGEPIADEDDLFGSSVILASRTKEKASGGEIFVTDVVRQLLSGKGFLFADSGEFEMKGFEEPVRLYEVRWEDA